MKEEPVLLSIIYDGEEVLSTLHPQAVNMFGTLLGHGRWMPVSFDTSERGDTVDSTFTRDGHLLTVRLSDYVKGLVN